MRRSAAAPASRLLPERPRGMTVPVMFLALLIGTINLLPAQDEPEPIQVEMVALVLEGEIKDLEYATADPLKTEKLDVYSRGFGTPVLYEGPPDLVFFRTLPALVEGAPPRRQVLATGRAPAGASRIMLLFHRVPGEKESYQLLVLNNDVAGFPPGPCASSTSRARPWPGGSATGPSP